MLKMCSMGEFFLILFLFLVFIVWPIWLFIKLARCGKGIFFPDFERMQREVYSGIPSVNNFFAYNRLGGKIFYYLLMLYVLGGLLFIIYSLAK